jgi:Protein of unknown function (DUF3006)
MTRATIDRIEGDKVVLILEGKEVIRLVSELPPHAREGDVVDPVTLEVDREATERLRREVQDARSSLRRGRLPDGEL